MPLSNYLEQRLVEELVGITDYPGPSTVEVSLHTANPTDSGGNEVTETNYNRVATSPSDWSRSSNDTISNDDVITFPKAGSAYSSDVEWFGLWDGSGNFLAYGQLDSPQTVLAGGIPEFDVSNLHFTIT